MKNGSDVNNIGPVKVGSAMPLCSHGVFERLNLFSGEAAGCGVGAGASGIVGVIIIRGGSVQG